MSHVHHLIIPFRPVVAVDTQQQTKRREGGWVNGKWGQAHFATKVPLLLSTFIPSSVLFLSGEIGNLFATKESFTRREEGRDHRDHRRQIEGCTPSSGGRCSAWGSGGIYRLLSGTVR